MATLTYGATTIRFNDDRIDDVTERIERILTSGGGFLTIDDGGRKVSFAITAGVPIVVQSD